MVAKSQARIRVGVAFLLVSAALSGCAPQKQGAASASPEPAVPAESTPPSASPSADEPSPVEPVGQGYSGKGHSETSEPEFKPGMSVVEAVNAVPQGAERVEIEHEVLIEPLMQPDIYAPCKLRPNQHFSVKVAIWDGHVVGLDVIATPKSEQVEACLRSHIEALSWKKKVKSLSTVEFNY
jgi:hypothetical protein